MNKRFDPVSGNIFSVFIYYAFPSIIGVLMMSCAVVIDGFFIGNHAGPIALASVNLTIPLTGFLFGIAMMFSVGGAARCGKYLGAGKSKAANSIFTQTVVLTGIIMLATSALGILFMDTLVIVLVTPQAPQAAAG